MIERRHLTDVASDMATKVFPDTAAAMNSDLTKYNAAKKALAEAIRIDEVKDIRDKAAAMRIYAMQAKDRVLIDQATEIRLRAERRAGELLRDLADRGERAVRKNMKSQPATSKLSDLDINKSQSSRWQKLAEIPEESFEELVANAKLKACTAVDRAQQPKPKPKRKRRAKKDAADIAATCVLEVEMIVRAAISKMHDPDERAGLFDRLEKAVRAIMSEATAQDHAHAGNGRAESDRWIET
jgi:hypothetical protein